VVSREQRRTAVCLLKGLKVSGRRSCQLVGISRHGVRYESRRSDSARLEKLQAIAGQHPRYGYRRACALLRRSGEKINHKRVHRVWQEAKLSLPLRRPRRKRALACAMTCSQAIRPNHVWSYDFVFERCANGQQIKLLTVIDEYTRESLAIYVAPSIKSRAVIEVLSRLIAERGTPLYLRSDNGSEFVATRVKEWLTKKGIETLYIEPGSPWQNAVGESFNGRLRDECLNIEWFNNLREAGLMVERWRRHYNDERPHSSLDYRTPSEFYAVYRHSRSACGPLWHHSCRSTTHCYRRRK
jgi:putative transposase